MASSCTLLIRLRFIGFAAFDCIQLVMTSLFSLNPFLRPLLGFTGPETIKMLGLYGKATERFSDLGKLNFPMVVQF